MSIDSELVAKQVFNTIQNLIATGTPEKFIFRRYRGDKVAKALSSGQKLKESDVDTVVLKVNPSQVSFDKKKIITKVQTSSPGRFVVYDWGTDLTVLSIQGNTGNLLPDNIVNGGNALSTFFNDVAAQFDQFAPENIDKRTEAQSINSVGTGIVTPFINNVMMGTMTYMELLNMSPKYKVFKKLENMFELSDADRDILVLEFGDYGIFRGYFESFTFDMVAETPWNWKYNIVFVILSDLNKAVQRMDDQFYDSSFIL
jgi:hypothetical protein